MSLAAHLAQPPLLAASFPVRPRLMTVFAQDHGCRLVVVSAPPGYGKTCLIAHWHDASGPDAIWIDPTREEEGPAAGGRSHEDRPATLPDIVAAAQGPVRLFIDNGDSLSVGDAKELRLLLEAGRSDLQIVLASRARPAIDLARLRSLARVAEYDASALRVTADELPLFLPDVAEGTASALLEATGGWAAGLKLAVLAAERGEVKPSGCSPFIREYFDEQLWCHLPRDSRHFLSATAILPLLTADMCGAVLNRDVTPGEVAAHARLGQFVVPDGSDGRTWRVHPLLRDFLLWQLEAAPAAERAQHHQRAAAALIDRGDYLDAFRQKLAAQDTTGAADILSKYYVAIRSVATDVEVEQMINDLPHAIRVRYPRFFRAQFAHHDFDEPKLLIKAERARLEDSPEAPQASHAAQRTLVQSESMLALLHDDIAALSRSYDNWSRTLSNGAAPNEAGAHYMSRIVIARERYDLKAIPQLEHRVRQLIDRLGWPEAFVMLESAVALAFVVAGMQDRADASLQRAFALAEAHSGRSSPMAAMVANLLAAVRIEQNRSEEAAALTHEFPVGPQGYGFTDALLHGYLTRARLALAEDSERSLDLLKEGALIAQQRGLERMRLHMAAEQIAICLRRGLVDRAKRAAEEIGCPANISTLKPGPGVTSKDEIRALACARMAMVTGNCADALALARRWRSFLSKAGAVAHLVKWDILASRLLRTKADNNGARRALRTALENAASSGLLRTVIEERDLLESLLDGPVAPADDSLSPALLHAIAEELKLNAPKTEEPEEDEDGSGADLSHRELKILGLCAQGMTYAEIGQLISVSEGTIKWYMNRIYAKLGVSRRILAVDKARRLGLLVTRLSK